MRQKSLPFSSPILFFFCNHEKNLVDYVRLDQMMSKLTNCRGQLTDDIGISVGCLILLPFCQVFFRHAKKLKHKNIFARRGNFSISSLAPRSRSMYPSSATDRKGYAFCFSIALLNTRTSLFFIYIKESIK